jgi:hypothetical protein
MAPVRKSDITIFRRYMAQCGACGARIDVEEAPDGYATRPEIEEARDRHIAEDCRQPLGIHAQDLRDKF